MARDIRQVMQGWRDKWWTRLVERFRLGKREAAPESTGTPGTVADIPAPEERPADQRTGAAQAAAADDENRPKPRWNWLKTVFTVPVIALLVAIIFAYKQWVDRPIAIEPFTIVSGTDISGISPAAIADHIKAHITRINSDAGDVFQTRKLGEASLPLDVKIADTGWTLANIASALKIELTSAQVTGRISQVGKWLMVQSTTSHGDRVWVDIFRIPIPPLEPVKVEAPAGTQHTKAQEIGVAPKIKPIDGIEEDPFLMGLDAAAACLALRIMTRASPEVAANYIFRQAESGEANSVDKRITQRNACIANDDVELYSQVSQDEAAEPAARVNALVGLSLHYSVTHQAFEELNVARAATGMVTNAIAKNDASIAYTLQRGACAVLGCQRGERIQRAAIAAWMQQGAAYSDYAGSASSITEATARRKSAIEAFNQVIRLKKDYGPAYNAIGTQWVAVPNKTMEAYDAYIDSLRVGETAAAHNDLGWLYINGRNAFYKEAEAQPGYLDLAEQQFAAAIRIQPDYWDAHASLGYALFQNGKFREAVDVLEPAVEHDSTNRDLLRELGSAYASQCRFDDAHSSFVAAYRNYKAARDENNMRNTLTDWGKVLDEFGLRNAAMAQENEVLHADPNHIYARQFLGQIEVADASSSVVAAGVESLRKAVEADADKHDFVLESYLDGLLKAGKHKTAIGVYEKWSKSGLVPPLAQSPSNGALAPPNQHVRLSYARALLQDGQTERALGQFEISERISIFPNVSDVSVLREQLRAGSTSPAIERRIGELAKFAIPVPLPHRCVAPTISTAKGLKGLTIH